MNLIFAGLAFTLLLRPSFFCAELQIRFSQIDQYDGQ